jgi:hypothetical protein
MTATIDPKTSVSDGGLAELFRPRVFWLLVALFLGLGVGTRVLPLFDIGGRLLRQFPTEDGYLMLTIARNIALGRGMSIAEGTIATNGTQPLTTILWAGCFALGGGDRSMGVALVLGLSLLASLLATWWLFRLGCEVLSGRPHAILVSALASSAWFASTLTVAHSMNCLETGVYTLVVIGVARLFVHWQADGATDWSWGRCALFGLALGAAFWARIDAVFLIASACLARVVLGFGGGVPRLRRRVMETFVFGLVSVLAATPWLINNLRFGSIMPISGQAESAGARFGGNVGYVPIKLAEYLSIVAGVPLSLEEKPMVVAITLLVVLAAVAIAVWAWRGAGTRAQALETLIVPYGVLLCGYYGLLFGAHHFMGRYFAPLGPFLALWTAAVLARAFRMSFCRHASIPVFVASLFLLVAAFGDVRMYLGGTKHQHFQVKDWVKGHVPESTWVGAIQTGTLGFFHERTINLDGKVNPAALRANKEKRLQEFIVRETEIDYLADWASLASWRTIPAIESAFELIVDDPKANLAVFRRTGSIGNAPAEMKR